MVVVVEPLRFTFELRKGPGVVVMVDLSMVDLSMVVVHELTGGSGMTLLQVLPKGIRSFTSGEAELNLVSQSKSSEKFGYVAVSPSLWLCPTNTLI